MRLTTFKKSLVYCSKDKEDWEKAKQILDESSVEYEAWHAEDVPMGGCGAKVDPRKFMNDKPYLSTIYKIEVDNDTYNYASAVLRGRVLAPRSYGFYS